jgi:hypothetical protein
VKGGCIDEPAILSEAKIQNDEPAILSEAKVQAMMASFLQIAAPILALLTAGLSLFLYLRLRSEFYEFRQLTRKAVTEQELSTKTNPLEVRLAEMELRLAASEMRRQEDADWLAQSESLNLNRRGQVLRLYRRGESADSIAGSLRMKPGEVQLIIKVFELGKAKID